MARQRLREPSIFQKGGHFWIRVTSLDGRRRLYINLGTTLSGAKRNRKDYMEQLESQNSNSLSYRINIQQGTEAYLAAKRKQLGSPNSFKRYSEMIANFKRVLELKFPTITYFDEIQECHISDYINYRVDQEKIAAKTANDERSTLSNMFKYLIDERNCLKHNPVKKVKPLAIPEPDEFFYSLEQTLLILDEAKKISKKIAWDDIFLTLFCTGMRRNELRFLTWEDIDLVRGRIYIRPKQIKPGLLFRPKGKEVREIPIHPQLLLPVLKDLPRTSERWVFVNSVGNYFAPDTMRTQFRKVCEAAGVPVRELHKTRHTWASLSTENGVPLDVIQAIGGWKDAQTMNRYKHLTESHKAKVFAEKFSLKKDENENVNGE